MAPSARLISSIGRSMSNHAKRASSHANLARTMLGQPPRLSLRGRSPSRPHHDCPRIMQRS
jgi:hypothetical protein